MLFLNAGLLHRVGPYRLYVDLSRRLAKLGLPVCRFDLGGLGDSNNRPEALTDSERMVMDVREVMDTLAQRWGVRQFLLIGLCAGAANAHTIAVRDERICGAIFLDGYQYTTLKFFWNEYGPKVRHLSKWLRLFKRIFNNARFSNDAENVENAVFVVDDLSRAQFTEDLRMLIQRSTALFYIYTGGLARYNYREQFEDAFRNIDFQGRVSVEYFGQTDHLYTLLEDRAMLMQCICDWTQRNFLTDTTDTPTKTAA